MRCLTLDRLALRWKLTATAAAASCFALGLVAVLMLVAFRSGLLDSVRRDLRQSGRAIAVLIDHAGPAALRSAGVEGRLRGAGATAEVIDAHGRVLLASGAVPAAPLAGHPQPSASPISLDHSDRGLVAEVIGLTGDRRLVLARPLRDLDLADESLRTALLIGVPVVLLLVVGGAYVVSARALAPVERMRRQAERIGAAADGTRLSVPHADDELAGLGRTLNELLDRVADAAAHERALVADASHELRTPLARLRARLELALDPPGDPARPADPVALAATLRETERDVRRLAMLADDLLGLASLDARRPGPRPLIDLHELIDEAVAARRPEVLATGRTITAVTDPLVLAADPSLLARALANLLDNAIVHGAGAITVSARRDGAGVEITVTDEGPGLDLPLARATQRFTRGAAARSRPGAGLGLALVRAIADAHGGQLTQHGAALVLTLPAATTALMNLSSPAG